MQRVFRVVETKALQPIGLKTTHGFDNNVRDNGVILPILVAEVPDADGVIQMEIIDGNRRVRAAKQAGIDKIPAVVLRDTSAEQRARLTLICNHLRSLNFFTESRAALVLADDNRALERETRLLGLSVTKVLGMVQKLERMPEPVRQAMWEERLQVSSAKDVAGFPPPLQAEVVARLEERGWLDTRTVMAMKAEWEARHGPLNPRSAARSRPQGPPPAPPPQWEGASPVPIDNGVPPQRVGGWQVRPVEASPPSTSIELGSSMGATATLPRPGSEPDIELGEVEAYVKVLDATLRDLVQAGKAVGISRSVWVDRAMRAWDRIGQPVGG